MSNAVVIGLVGLGYWGPNVLRNLLKQELCEQVVVFDSSHSAVEGAKRHFKSVRFARSYDEMLQLDDLKGVVIATPLNTHYELAMSAFKAGKDVLVEKPMVDNLNHAKELLRVCSNQDRKFLVGHTYLYQPAVQMLREQIANGSLGRLLYMDSTRANLGLFRSDTNVLFDLASHDISIIDYLTDRKPETVSCLAVAAIRQYAESLAHLSLRYSDGFLAHIYVNWLSPVKIRQMVVGGDLKMAVYDDSVVTEKVKIFDAGVKQVPEVNLQGLRLQYRSGDIWSPALRNVEPLESQCSDFLSAVVYRTAPLSDAFRGARVVAVLAAAHRSIEQRGQEVPVEY